MRIQVYLDVIDMQTGIRQLPVKYRSILLSFLKESLRSVDKEIYHQLYESGAVAKKLSFALRMIPAKMDKELGVFTFDSAVLTISSSDIVFMSKLLAGITRKDTFLYKERYRFKVTSISVLNQPAFRTKTVTFKTLSPILFEDITTKPVLIDDPRFEDIVNIYTNSRFNALYNRSLHEPLTVVSSRLRVCMVKETNRHAEGRELYYTTQLGAITLSGHPEDLELLYLDGFGKRASQGFGCLTL